MTLHYFVTENDGTPLKKVTSEKTLRDFLPAMLDEDHNVRIVVRRAWLPAGLAFSLSSFRQSKFSRTRYVVFTWLHGSGSREIVTVLAELLDCSLQEDTDISWRVSTSETQIGGVARRGVSNTLREAVASFDRKSDSLDAADGATFVQLRAHGRIAFADLTLMEETEMQASLTLAGADWTPDVETALCRSAAETANLSEFPLPFSKGILLQELKALWPRYDEVKSCLLEQDYLPRIESDTTPEFFAKFVDTLTGQDNSKIASVFRSLSASRPGSRLLAFSAEYLAN